MGSRQTVRENPTEVGNQDGLPRRHDYDIEIMANTATGHYVDEDEVFGAISFPTLRRAVRRLTDGTTDPEPVPGTIDISHVTVEFRAPGTD